MENLHKGMVEAEGGAGGAYTSFGDSGNTVLRYRPAGVTAVTSANIALPSTINGPVVVIAAVRNNSGTTTWPIKTSIGGFGYQADTPTQSIDASSTQPRLVLLGSTIAVSGATINVTVQASAASGSLDIGYLIVVGHSSAVVNTGSAVACSFSVDGRGHCGFGNQCADETTYDAVGQSCG